MAEEFSIVVVNESGATVDVLIFQTEADTSGVMPLAWLPKSIGQEETVRFSWDVEYQFVWAPLPKLQPGAVFRTAAVVPANLSTANETTLTAEDGALSFTSPIAGPFAGTLTIRQDASIPEEAACVGIGMAGTATIAAPAVPRSMLAVTPNTQYWLALGQFVTGQVLDLRAVSPKVRVEFPANVVSMNVVIERNGAIRITPSEDV